MKRVTIDEVKSRFKNVLLIDYVGGLSLCKYFKPIAVEKRKDGGYGWEVYKIDKDICILWAIDFPKGARFIGLDVADEYASHMREFFMKNLRLTDKEIKVKAFSLLRRMCEREVLKNG